MSLKMRTAVFAAAVCGFSTAACGMGLLPGPTGGSAPIPPPTISFVQENQTVSSTPASSFVSHNITGTTAGNTFILGISWGNPQNVTTVTSNNGSTCARATGAIGGGPPAVAIYRCPNAASGTVAFTVTLDGSVPFNIIDVLEFSGVSGDVGIGNGNFNASATTLTVTATGTLTQNNQLVATANTCGVCTGTTTPTGYTSGGGITAYQLINSSGATPSATWGFTGGTGDVVAALAAFSHP